MCFSQGSGFGVSGRGQEEERNAEEVERSLMGSDTVSYRATNYVTFLRI